MRRKQCSTCFVVLLLSFFSLLTFSTPSTLSIGQCAASEPTDSREVATESNVAVAIAAASHVVDASIKSRRFPRESHLSFDLAQCGAAASQRAVSHSSNTGTHSTLPTV